VKIIVQVKLLPVPEETAALAATLQRANEAANWLSELAYTRNVKSRQGLQRLAYREVKERFGLSAQPTLHVIRKVADAYATLAANLNAGNLGRPGSKRYAKAARKPIRFRPDAAQPFDDRCLSWQLDAGTVSVWTTGGRLRDIRFVCSEATRKLLAEHRKGETDLVCRDGLWLLSATCDIPEAPPNTAPAGWLGIDLGIVNIATTSDGTIHAGRGLNRHRRRQLQLRRKLQAKNTKSAKRVLKRQRRKESRRARDANHIISKRIVAEAQRTARGIGLEDLSGICDRARLSKPQRAMLHSWAFAQFGQFIVYKAQRAGVPVVYVDPAYTSRTCADCGHVDKRNRVSQAWFACRSCGVVAHADRNGSRNISHRAGVVWDAGGSHPPLLPDPLGLGGWTRPGAQQPAGNPSRKLGRSQPRS
jgi:putative transposase